MLITRKREISETPIFTRKRENNNKIVLDRQFNVPSFTDSLAKRSLNRVILVHILLRITNVQLYTEKEIISTFWCIRRVSPSRPLNTLRKSSPLLVLHWCCCRNHFNSHISRSNLFFFLNHGPFVLRPFVGLVFRCALS